MSSYLLFQRVEIKKSISCLLFTSLDFVRIQQIKYRSLEVSDANVSLGQSLIVFELTTHVKLRYWDYILILCNLLPYIRFICQSVRNWKCIY